MLGTLPHMNSALWPNVMPFLGQGLSGCHLAAENKQLQPQIFVSGIFLVYHLPIDFCSICKAREEKNNNAIPKQYARCMVPTCRVNNVEYMASMYQGWLIKYTRGGLVKLQQQKWAISFQAWGGWLVYTFTLIRKAHTGCQNFNCNIFM